MELSNNFYPLLLIVVLAFLVPLLLSRFRSVPVVVGEIVAGVIIGISGLNLVEHSTTIDVLGDIGLAFLMFLAGMEIDLKRLFQQSGQRSTTESSKPFNLLAVSGGIYALTLVLAIPGGFFLNWLGLESNPWLLVFILSATSLGVVLPVLKQRGLMASMPGQVVFFTALLADFITVLLLTIFIITLNRGLDLEVFSVGLLFVAFFVFYQLGGRLFRINAVRRLVEELSHVTVQIKVRGAIAILMAFVVLAGVLGVELILGAFLAGMIITALRSPDDVDFVHKLEAFGYGFFIPLFFILVGVNLDLGAVVESPQILLITLVLVVVSFAIKFLSALPLRRWLSWQEVTSASLLLDTHLSLEIAVAIIGVRLGLISQSANAAIILFALLTVLIMPLLFNALQGKAETRTQRFFLIAGGADLALQTAQVLNNHDERVKFWQPDAAAVGQIQKGGYEILESQALNSSLAADRINQISAMLALSLEDTQNLDFCKQALQLGIGQIVAYVNEPSRLQEYQAMGVKAFTPGLYRSAFLAWMARNPQLFNLVTSTADNKDVREFSLQNPAMDGQRLSGLGLPSGLLVLSISRNGDQIVPHGNTRLAIGDCLALLGEIDDLKEASLALESC